MSSIHIWYQMKQILATGAFGKTEHVVLHLLRSHGAQTASDLARLSGLGKATISRAVTRLRDVGVLEELGSAPQKTGPGRTGTQLHIRSDRELYLGLHIRSDGIEAVLTDVTREVILHTQTRTDYPADREARLAMLIETCRGAVRRAERDFSRLCGVGIALPAPIHPETGEIGHAVRIPQWHGADFGADLADILHVPVVVENDSNCAAMFEIAMSDRYHGESFAYIHLDRGVGGAILINGAIWRGSTGRAGNFGHIPYDPNGEFCRCGGRGCYEKYVSLPALLARLEPVCGAIDFDQLLSRLEKGEHAIRRVVEETGSILGTLMANLSRSIDPPVFVLGGRLINAGAPLVEAARTQLQSLNQSAGAVHVSSTASEEASRATAIGAVILLIDTVSRRNAPHRNGTALRKAI